MTKKILTIQDLSCVGQCSLTVALPVISAAGIETAVLPTAVLSTHTGGEFSDFTFRDLTEDMPNIYKSWQKNGQMFDCIYTGYIAGIKQLDYINEIIAGSLKQDGKIIIDPVMGDFGEYYKGFNDDFAKKMSEFCENADVIMPNLTEACILTSTKYRQTYDKSYVESLMVKLADICKRYVVLTGVSFDNANLGVSIFDKERNKSCYYFHKKYNRHFYGTGDLFASALTGAFVGGANFEKSVQIADKFVTKAIENTLDDSSHWYGVHFEKALPYYISLLNEK